MKENYVGKHAKANDEFPIPDFDPSYRGNHAPKDDPWGEDYLNSVPEFAGEVPNKDEAPAETIGPRTTDDLDMETGFDAIENSSEEIPGLEVFSDGNLKKIMSILKNSDTHLNNVREFLKGVSSAEDFIAKLDLQDRLMLADSGAALTEVETKEPDELYESQAEYTGKMDDSTTKSQNLLGSLYEVASMSLPSHTMDRSSCLHSISSLMDNTDEIRGLAGCKSAQPKQPTAAEPAPAEQPPIEPSPFL